MRKCTRIGFIAALAIGAAAARGEHALSLQGFTIPLTSDTGSDVGFGFSGDYEFRFHENVGAFVGYLQAEYEEESRYYSTYTTWVETDEVSIGGPMAGLRFRVKPSAQSSGYAMLGGALGLWNKEDVRRGSDETEEEDVVALIFTLAYVQPFDDFELGFGSDFGGISGDDAGAFLTFFLRAGYRFGGP